MNNKYQMNPIEGLITTVLFTAGAIVGAVIVYPKTFITIAAVLLFAL